MIAFINNIPQFIAQIMFDWIVNIFQPLVEISNPTFNTTYCIVLCYVIIQLILTVHKIVNK